MPGPARRAEKKKGKMKEKNAPWRSCTPPRGGAWRAEASTSDAKTEKKKGERRRTRLRLAPQAASWRAPSHGRPPSRRPSRPSRRTRPTPDRREKKRKKGEGKPGLGRLPPPPALLLTGDGSAPKKTARKKLRTSSTTLTGAPGAVDAAAVDAAGDADAEARPETSLALYPRRPCPATRDLLLAPLPEKTCCPAAREDLVPLPKKTLPRYPRPCPATRDLLRPLPELVKKLLLLLLSCPIQADALRNIPLSEDRQNCSHGTLLHSKLQSSHLSVCPQDLHHTERSLASKIKQKINHRKPANLEAWASHLQSDTKTDSSDSTVLHQKTELDGAASVVTSSAG